MDVGVAEDSKPFLGNNFQTTLRDLESQDARSGRQPRVRDRRPRLRDEIKRLKLMDLEFANEAMTPAGETVDREVVKTARSEARAEAAARFRKGRR